MPSFEKSPPELVQRFDEIAELLPQAHRRKMFGYPTCVVNGNLFMGLHQDHFFLRLGDTDRAEFVSSFGADPFQPMPGRPMKEYVIVPPKVLRDPEIERWASRSFSFARSLPPKPQPSHKQDSRPTART